MSFVSEIGKEEKNIRKHEAAHTTYSVSIVGGNKLFQINSYGSKGRKDKGKLSQVIQFDRKLAEELVGILTSEFEL